MQGRFVATTLPCFYISYISTKPIAISSCVTVTLQVVVEQGFTYEDPQVFL